MNARIVGSLLRNDIRLIFRDPLLVVLSVLMLAVGLACRWALPALDVGLADGGLMTGENGDLRFSDTYPLWVAFIGIWQAALMPGVIFAFLLLDEKKDGTLQAMRVTPVPLRGYLAYRVALPYLMAFVFQLVLPSLIGIQALGWTQRVPVALVGALAAPLLTLTFASLANDKVQGLALTKFAGVAGLTIIVAFFVGPVWRWVLGLFPPVLVTEAYWRGLEGESGGALRLVIAAVLQLSWLALLVRRFRSTV